MRTRGFTLIEAILAIALFAIGLFGMIYVFENTVANALVVDQTYVATSLARETMETIIAKRDCALGGCGYASTLAAVQANTYNANPITGFTGYSVTAVALEVDPGTSDAATNFTVASSGSGYARLTVTVTFNGGANTVQLVTLMANYT